MRGREENWKYLTFTEWKLISYCIIPIALQSFYSSIALGVYPSKEKKGIPEYTEREKIKGMGNRSEIKR